ncbi:unnamed protein product [Paramecium pentaurelia]|uniref:Transmembrane protein n=1 Tax=Paramecium pentaurelia TaxID=43138 RepID=A0A8S1YN96_9CILI|nr:unnamed protein product [Paramecium pentaurelia]
MPFDQVTCARDFAGNSIIRSSKNQKTRKCIIKLASDEIQVSSNIERMAFQLIAKVVYFFGSLKLFSLMQKLVGSGVQTQFQVQHRDQCAFLCVQSYSVPLSLLGPKSQTFKLSNYQTSFFSSLMMINFFSIIIYFTDFWWRIFILNIIQSVTQSKISILLLIYFKFQSTNLYEQKVMNKIKGMLVQNYLENQKIFKNVLDKLDKNPIWQKKIITASRHTKYFKY